MRNQPNNDRDVYIALARMAKVRRCMAVLEAPLQDHGRAAVLEALRSDTLGIWGTLESHMGRSMSKVTRALVIDAVENR